MSFVQVPPAPGSSGQNIESFIVSSSQHRQAFVLGDGESTAVSPVTSSGGLLASIASGTITLSSMPALSSGIVTLSSPTSLSSGTVTLSSAASLSSGTVTLSSAPLVVVASSGGTIPVTLSTVFSLSSATSLSSGTVTLSSAPLVIVASSGGTIPVTLSTVVSLSSAPTVAQGASGLAGTSTGPWIIDQRIQMYSSVVQAVEISATSSGHVTVVSAISSMSIYVLGYALIADSSNTMEWESSNTNLSGSLLFSTGGAGIVCPLIAPSQGFWLKTSVNGDLGILQGNPGTIGGHLTYFTASS